MNEKKSNKKIIVAAIAVILAVGIAGFLVINHFVKSDALYRPSMSSETEITETNGE